MLQFLIDNWIMTAIALASVVLGVAGVVYGVLTRGRWVDRGLMVRDGVRLRWASYRIPLALSAPDVPYEVDLAIASAISAFAEVIGRDVLVRHVRPHEGAKQTDGADVVVNMSGVDAGGSADLEYDERTGEIRRVDVTIANGLSLDLLPRAVLHELGHALGLDHDESSRSIMNPVLDRRPSTFTDRDREFLRKLYG